MIRVRVWGRAGRRRVACVLCVCEGQRAPWIAVLEEDESTYTDPGQCGVARRGCRVRVRSLGLVRGGADIVCWVSRCPVTSDRALDHAPGLLSLGYTRRMLHRYSCGSPLVEISSSLGHSAWGGGQTRLVL